MREDSEYKRNDLHWHNGNTCHGSPTLQECTKEAIDKGWVGKVLRRDDKYRDGTPVSCYTLISDHFQHHGKQGTWVAVVELVARVL